jgi:hypothetical protein
MRVFFSVHGIALIDILPEKAKLSFKYSTEIMVKEFDPILYLTKRKSHANCTDLHFDTALFRKRE